MANNIFSAIPKNLEAEKFEQLVKTDVVRIERIVSKGHKSPESGWYDQDEEEWVMIVRGEAIVLFEDNTSIIMKEGDFINIPAHKKHKVEWTAPNIETIWLAVHYQK